MTPEDNPAHEDPHYECANEIHCLECELTEARAALAGTRDVPITVLTWQPGGSRGNWPTLAANELILTSSIINGEPRLRYQRIWEHLLNTRNWFGWGNVEWYAHLSGVTLPGPAGETEDDAE